MIFFAKNNMVFIHEIGGSSVDLLMPNLIPIQKSLEFEGGKIWCKSVWLDYKSEYLYLLYYTTNCNKITMKVELTEEEFTHNLEFFGNPEVNYESAILFHLDGNKFKMP